MSKTPRTDREVYKVSSADIGFEVVNPALCRDLEERLSEAQSALRMHNEATDTRVLVLERELADEVKRRMGAEEALEEEFYERAKNPNPSGRVVTAASPPVRGEASGPVGLGPHVECLEILHNGILFAAREHGPKEFCEAYVDSPRCKIVEALLASAHCRCTACRDGVPHASDCAVHNMPAHQNAPCDCGAT